jgi:hypothetical protein
MVLHHFATLDRVIHAMSHPARRTMLRNLAADGARNLTELNSAEAKPQAPGSSEGEP